MRQNRFKSVAGLVGSLGTKQNDKSGICGGKTNIELVETMWNQFSNLGIYELNVIDTTTHSIKDTVSAVKEKIVSGTALLF